MAGQPPYYKTPEEMQIAIDKYFDSIATYNATQEKFELYKHPTVTGLALALGFSSRQSLLDYERDGKYFDTVKSAKTRIEEYIENRLYSGQVTGCIFNLKNNFKWKDSIENNNTNANIDVNQIDKERAKAINETLDDIFN